MTPWPLLYSLKGFLKMHCFNILSTAYFPNFFFSCPLYHVRQWRFGANVLACDLC